MKQHKGVSTWCIDHPVATFLLTIALVLVGVIAFPPLPIAPFPEAKFPFRKRGIRKGREGNNPDQYQRNGQQNRRHRVVDAPGRNAFVLLHGLGSACTTCGGSLMTCTVEPGLSRDWPSLTNTSPGFTPLMMSWPLP